MNASKDRHAIIGTAGHVDHGKTALIRALTGSETDRLQEEKKRGISITLGFAPFTLPNGQIAGVVDVPGHERFISNMLAGIGGIDLVLLVIDVMEGMMPQTHEHLEILELLQIRRGIIVLNKCDLAEEDWIELVEEEIREKVSGTFLHNAPIRRVSSVSGTGIDALRYTIQKTIEELPAKNCAGLLRLPVDRHFTVDGFGTVITGTLLSGEIRAGDSVDALPAGDTIRVREVQVHGQRVDKAFAGQRVALNLAGLDRSKLERGSVICSPGVFEQTQRIDVRLSLLQSASRPLKFRAPVHVYLGTARVVGLVALLDRDELKPGESVVAQIHLERPLVAHREDRFIIRSYSPMTTIGGGKVLDAKPVKHRRFREEIIEALAELESGEKAFLFQKVTSLGPIKQKELETVSGLGKERVTELLETLQQEKRVTLLGNQWLSYETERSWQIRLAKEVYNYHQNNPLLPGIPRATLKSVLPPKLALKGFDQLLNTLSETAKLEQSGEWIKNVGFSPTPTEDQRQKIQQIVEIYINAGTQTPIWSEVLDTLNFSIPEAEKYLAYLLGTGVLVRLNEETIFHQEVYQQSLLALQHHFAGHSALTLAEFRDILGSARKQTKALLDHFDERQYTIRRGDERVAWKLPENRFCA